VSAYSAEVLAHFRDPRGAGRLPEGESGVHSGEARDDEGGQRVRLHLRAALRNGVTRDEIKEVLLQMAVYCGVPAANTAFHVAAEVLAEKATRRPRRRRARAGVKRAR